MLRFRIGILAPVVTLSLSGCVWFDPPPAGCEVHYVKGSEWDIQGVKIPLSSKPTDIIEIGKLKFTGAQAQQLSDAVSAMDISRRTMCTIVSSKSFATLSPAYREKTFDKLAAISATMASFGSKVSLAATPEAAVKVAVEQKESVMAVVEKPDTPGTPAPPASGADGSVTAPAKLSASIDESVRQEVVALKSILATLTSEVDELKANGSYRLKVEGFEINGVSLPAGQRASLVAKVRAAFSRLPSSRTPNVLVIGYADGQGDQTYNVAIALRRAEAVAQLLRKHDFGREFHTEVTSGGVYGRGAGSEGRRVDIIVSRNHQAPATA
jgi:hypothetical protein